MFSLYKCIVVELMAELTSLLANAEGTVSFIALLIRNASLSVIKIKKWTVPFTSDIEQLLKKNAQLLLKP